MSIELWFAFVVAAAVLLIVPGPTVLTVISYSMSQDRQANIALVSAVALGHSTSLLVSIHGLGALLATSAFWFTAVKCAGSLYFLHLGIKLFRAGVSPVALNMPAVPVLPWKVFVNTYIVTALNPKGIVFFVAFLPQFVDRSANEPRQTYLLAATFVLMATINASLYAMFAASARELLASPRARRRFNLSGGSLLSAASVWALLAKRPA